ncbi:hypothetical protein F3Y22_tig00116943pilonHSYRG00016 [Hibiscus syriacus]|uniref:HAT C-terminal dimerisation domain-containing protein n=1 Tax=Hibiscus syriacus TaxID=106335 RepID=A0A6A2XXC8_HIBSY|nr:hypothetical protein F3Y22_tig00116943pilonHSYRG00016 [Hibiscus syriacus]
MEATNLHSSKSTNEVPNLEEAHDENKEGGSKVEKDKRKRKVADEHTSKNPEAKDEASCNWCAKSHACDSHKNGTSNMINHVIFVAVVLDPRNKFRFVEWGMDKIYEKDIAGFMSQKVKEELYEMFEKYRFFANQGQLETCVLSSNEKRTINTDSIDNELSVEFEKYMDLRENLNKNELDLYLMEALEKKINPNFDILNWWEVNSTKYPILGQLARDVLAINVTTVASESDFSIGGRVLNCYRSSLTPKTVEALICTQNWCRSSPISTDVEELVEDLEKLVLVSKFVAIVPKFVAIVSKFVAIVSKFAAILSKFVAIVSKFVAIVSKFVAIVSKFVAIISKFVAIVSKFVAIVSKFVVIVSKFVVIVSNFVAIVSKFVTIVSKFVAIVSKFVAIVSKFVAIVSKFVAIVSKFVAIISKFVAIVSKFVAIISKFVAIVSKFVAIVSKFVAIYSRGRVEDTYYHDHDHDPRRDETDSGDGARESPLFSITQQGKNKGDSRVPPPPPPSVSSRGRGRGNTCLRHVRANTIFLKKILKKQIQYHQSLRFWTIAMNLETIATNLETITTNLETIATNLETIATNLETIATNLETITTNLETNATNLETIATNLETIATHLETIVTNLENRNANLDYRNANISCPNPATK